MTVCYPNPHNNSTAYSQGSENCSKPKLTVGSLFAGIGGFDLGLERTGGFEIKWQVEIDEYFRRVLEKHWPHVKRYGDIREIISIESVDVICGGFPCQPVSAAGKRLGADDERWLWPGFARIIRMVRPRFVLVENVPGLLSLGMGSVLGDLSEIGYDAEWQSIPAAAVGAPHIRDRVWILAYPRQINRGDEGRNHNSSGRSYLLPEGNRGDATLGRQDWELIALVPGIHPRSSKDWWVRQSRVARSVNGLSRELVDARNGALGNAVVPQIVTWIGQRILEWEAQYV